MTSGSPPPLVLTRMQVREVDRRAIDDYGLPGLVLMENAGRNAANLLRELGIHGPVVLCCGKGNNAGDGFVIARHLENSGFDVRVLLSTPASSFTGDAATNFVVLRRAGTPIVEAPANIAITWHDELARADWIVDALLGTGTQGTVREPFASAIAAINAAHRKVLAVDLPSGLDCDSGAVLGNCVRARHTATFVARKPGFEVNGASEFTGEVHVLDIGVPRALLRELSESSAASSGPSE
ncbi:MAG: NAD(P)H-hydrate epimerase [Planctomycetota bacterium]